MEVEYGAQLLSGIKSGPSASAPGTLAEALRRGILGLAIPEGIRLCSLSDLRNRTGLSMGVIREAVQLLQSDGLLEVRQGSSGGLFVRRARRDSLVRTLETLFHSNQISRELIVEARRELEGLCGRLAAINASREDIEALEENIEYMATLVDSPVEFARENVKFHLMISDATGNPILSMVAGALRDLFFSESIGVEYSEITLQHAVNAHRKILRAIEERNVDDASDAIRNHANALEDTLRNVGGRGDESAYFQNVNA